MRNVLQFVLALAVFATSAQLCAQSASAGELGQRLGSLVRARLAEAAETSAIAGVDAPEGSLLKCGDAQVIIENLRHIGAHAWQFSARCPGERPILARVRTVGEITLRTVRREASQHAVVERPLVTSGHHATLEIYMQGMRLIMPVVALEKGSAGQDIRVRALDGHQEYTARIVRADLFRIGSEPGGAQ